MAGRKSYVAAHPNGTDTVALVKGGKTPTFATWVLKADEWTQVGFSFGDRAKAERTAKSAIGSLGWQYTVTRVLPASI